MWVIGRFYALMIQEIIKDLCILQPWRGRNHVVIRHVLWTLNQRGSGKENVHYAVLGQ